MRVYAPIRPAPLLQLLPSHIFIFHDADNISSAQSLQQKILKKNGSAGTVPAAARRMNKTKIPRDNAHSPDAANRNGLQKKKIKQFRHAFPSVPSETLLIITESDRVDSGTR
jgi:hypothetical protein